MNNQGETTVPARKLMDIAKSAAEQTDIIRFEVDGARMRGALRPQPFLPCHAARGGVPQYRGGQQRFGAGDRAPYTRQALIDHRLLHGAAGRPLLPQRHAVRAALNLLRTVATDGHRLAVCARPWKARSRKPSQKLIVPRKGILELARLSGRSGERTPHPGR